MYTVHGRSTVDTARFNSHPKLQDSFMGVFNKTDLYQFQPTINRHLDNQTLVQSATWTIRHLDNQTLGQSDTWTIRHLDNQTHGQSDTWTIRHLDTDNILFLTSLFIHYSSALIIKFKYNQFIVQFHQSHKSQQRLPSPSINLPPSEGNRQDYFT